MPSSACKTKTSAIKNPTSMPRHQDHARHCVASRGVCLSVERECTGNGCSLFFFNDTATTEIYTLSLHDALPISVRAHTRRAGALSPGIGDQLPHAGRKRRSVRLFSTTLRDRKSTRLNSSHSQISYAVFCLQNKDLRNKESHLNAETPGPRPPLRGESRSLPKCREGVHRQWMLAFFF